jgi:hypothetical protein
MCQIFVICLQFVVSELDSFEFTRFNSIITCQPSQLRIVRQLECLVFSLQLRAILFGLSQIQTQLLATVEFMIVSGGALSRLAAHRRLPGAGRALTCPWVRHIVAELSESYQLCQYWVYQSPFCCPAATNLFRCSEFRMPLRTLPTRPHLSDSASPWYPSSSLLADLCRALDSSFSSESNLQWHHRAALKAIATHGGPFDRTTTFIALGGYGPAHFASCLTHSSCPRGRRRGDSKSRHCFLHLPGLINVLCRCC